jgi:hypothetical protein
VDLASTVEGLACGRWLPHATRLAWNTREMSKRLAGRRYLQIRKLLLRHDSSVRWETQNLESLKSEVSSLIGL